MTPEGEFRDLFDAQRNAVHAYFVGRTGDVEAAADLTQEVFLRAWRALRELLGRDEDGRRAWLFTVARNISIDAHRSARVRAGTTQVLARQPQPASVAPEVAVLASERIKAVGAAIRRLPEAHRVTLTMAAAGGLTSEEIGVALGIPAGTVRYRLSTARRVLAAALDCFDDAEIEEETR